MRRNKIFILGGRSGTSLMIRLLCRSGFKNWTPKHQGEPKEVREIIRKTYPNVPMSVFDTAQKGWQVTKLPHWDFIVDLIIRKYKNPLFIIMNRNLFDILKSYKGVGWSGWCFDEMKRSPGIANALIDFMGRKPETDDLAYLNYIKLCINLRNEALKDYPKRLMFFIDFDEFMIDFERVMKRLCKFLRVKPNMKKFNRLRKIRFSPSNKGVNTYIEEAKKKEKTKESG